MPPSKAAAGRKGYRNKSHSLEVVVRDKINTLSKLQAEAVFLKQKGAVLELLLEVSSEVAVHKRTHTGAKFPELHDTQLLEFLEQFLDSYGGFAADRPTAHNYFQLERLDVDQFKDVRRQDFLEKYTSLVQRLSLLLLQATDNSMKGGLTTTIDDLKQLLLGTLLWSPLTFMQVGTHHLVNGEPLQPDPEHSTKTVSGIDLGPEQEDVLAIIAELYNSQVASMEAYHISLCQVLDAELAQPGSSSGGVAATIMRVSSNMHRLLAIHQLFHVAIMHNLADQQLAHLCVRCFPRFPCMQDLLNALVRMRDQRAKGGLDPPDAPGTTIAATTRDLSSYGHIGLAAGVAPGEPRKPLQKPVVLDASVLSKGRLAEAGSQLLRSSSGLLTSSGVSIKEEGRSTGGAGEADQGSDAAAGAVLEHGVPRSPQPADAGGDDVTRRPLKEWDVLGNADAGSLTPSRPESTGAAGGGPGSSHKRARSPASAAAASSSRIGSSGSKAAKRLGLAGPPAAPAATTYSSGSAQQQQQPGRKAGKPDDRWPRQQQGAAGRNPASSDGMDVSLAVVAAAAAAGMPVDPAAAAALPVPLEQLPAQPAVNTSSAGQQQGSLLPPQAIQQLAAVLNSAGGPADMMQLLSSQPKLALLLQQQPQLLGQLQEAMAAQQQSHQQQQGHALPDLLQAVAAGSAAAGMSSQGLQQGYPAPHRSLSDANAAQQQGRHWDAAAQGAAGLPTSMPALEMLPPSLMAKDPGAGASPLQTLLHSVATLLQACSSVTEAATAAIDGGQGEFVTSAVSAAEAALTTALKGLQDIKGRCQRGASSSAGAAAAARAAATAALAGPTGGAGQLGLPPAGPSASRLQPPAGIPMPDPAHASQAVLPQSLSLALSGTHTTAEPPPHSNSALLAGMGLSHGAASQAASQGPGPAAGRAGQRQQQGYAASVAAAAAAVSAGHGGDVGPSGTTSRAPGGSSTNDQRAQQQQQQQQPSFGALLQQLSSTLTEHPAAVGQLAQILQQQGQQLTPEVSAVLAKLVGAASAGGTASDLASIVALLQPKQEQPDGSQQKHSSAWGAGHHHASAPPGFDPAGGRAPMGVSQGLPASSRGPVAYTSQAAPAGAVPVSSGAPAAPAPGAAGAAVGGGPSKAKEDSPSAGSSTTNTGQSGRQPGSQDPLAAAAEIAAQHAAALGIDPQQLEGIARAAAAALAGQQGPGQAEALVSSMMQFLQQKGPGGAGGGVGGMASMLQAMMSSAGVGPGSLQPKQAAAPAASAPAAPAGNARSMAQSAAAAATMIPPAAAAAMAAKQAAAAAAAGSNSGRRQAVADFGDMEADAASALEMLAAAAVGSQQGGRPQGKRDW